MRLFDEFRRLAIETIAVTMLALSRGPTLDKVLADYGLVGGGFANLPIPLPGTAFTKAKQALARILAVYDTCVREHHASPKDDGLSRILAARTEDGRSITTEEVKMELHHVVVAGLIVWAWFVGAILELSKRPDLRDRLIREIETHCPLWGIRSSHIRPEIYADPEEFDPSRLSPPRAEHQRHEHEFVPNGAGPPTGHELQPV